MTPLEKRSKNAASTCTGSTSTDNDRNEHPQCHRHNQMEIAVKLRQLVSARESKREQVESLFQRKRSLMEQIKNVEEQMNQLHSILFEMDDQITTLEETLGTTSEALLQTGTHHDTGPVPVISNAHTETDTSTLPSHSRPPGEPLTINPDQIIPDPSMTRACTDADADAITHTQLTQRREEILTDPLTALTCTQTISPKQPAHTRPLGLTGNESHHLIGVTATASVRPQILLQPANHATIPNAKAEPLHTSQCHYTTDDICRVLKDTFHIQSFRENQLAVIEATLSKQDCFVIMRTGGGKSLLYQLPVVLERPKITLVISPLLSLMQDQQDQVNAFCPNVCVSFHSGLSKSEQASNWRRVKDSSQGVGMILVTPERVLKSNLLKAELQTLYANHRFARIVIDECHCCCQWGHDFRPDYAKLGVLRKTFPNVPILAVTATASDRVREDCCQILRLRSNYRFFRSTANRPNLTYSIQRKDGSALDTMDDIVHFIQTKHSRSAGIVYTRTRKEADTVASQLAERGIVAEAYYSDVSPTKKAKIHKDWMRNMTQVVVATIAFGLGINKPDVRFVIHHSMSKTLEAYYQESGRAGRDGLPADCVLYYSPRDVPKMIGMVHAEQSSHLTWTMIKYAQHFGSDAVCRAILLQNLGEPNHDMETALQHHQDSTTPRDVLAHSQTVLQLLFSLQDEKTTMPMLIKEWRANVKTSPHQCVRDNPPGKDLSSFECEYIIVALMLQQLIATDVQYTAYDTVVYLRCTERAEQFLTSPRAQMTIRLPPNPVKSPAAGRKSTTPNLEGWIESKTKKRRQSSASAASTNTKKRQKPSKKAAPKSTKVKSTSNKKSATMSKSKVPPKDPHSTVVTTEIIHIDDDSTSDEEPIIPRRPRRKAASKINPEVPVDDDLMIDSDPDEEYEFEG